MKRNNWLQRLLFKRRIFVNKNFFIMSARCTFGIISHCWGNHRWTCDHSSMNRFSPCCLSRIALKSSEEFVFNYIVILSICIFSQITLPIIFSVCSIPGWTVVICFSLFEFYHFQSLYPAGNISLDISALIILIQKQLLCVGNFSNIWKIR